MNIVTPSSPAIASSSSSKHQYGSMSNPSPLSSGSLSSVPLGNLASTSVAAANVSTSSVGSIILANNNHGTSSTTAAAAVAAAAAKMNGNAVHHKHRLSATTAVPSSPSLMTCPPNGAATVYPPLTQLSTAKAIAAAVAAAAATVVQQQQHYRQQQLHPLSKSVTVASSHMTGSSKNSIRDGSTCRLDGSSQKQSLVMSNNVDTSATGISGCSSSFVAPFSGGIGGYNDTVRTIAATVGATSLIATLASPVPSTMLLTTSSSGSHSNNTVGTTVNHAHRFRTGDALPSSSTSSVIGVSTFTASSTTGNPMNSHTQSNAPNISSQNGSQSVGTPAECAEHDVRPDASNVNTIEVPAALADFDTLRRKEAYEMHGAASKHDIEDSLCNKSKGIHQKLNTLKHKLTDSANDDEPASKVATNMREVNNYSCMNMTETGELMAVANDGDKCLHNGLNLTEGSDTAVTSALVATNGLASGQSPTRIERFNIVL